MGLWLGVIAYNLANPWRLVLPKRIEGWSLTSLQHRLVKTTGRLVKHARYYCLMLADKHLDAAAVWKRGAADCRWPCRPDRARRWQTNKSKEEEWAERRDV